MRKGNSKNLKQNEVITMKNNLIKIGQVKIDSGSLLLCDPRRTTQGIDFMQTAFSFLGIGDRYQVGNDIGVLVPTQVNGTTCNIEALVEETPDNKQIITGINVRFINPGIDMPVLDAFSNDRGDMVKTAGNYGRRYM